MSSSKPIEGELLPCPTWCVCGGTGQVRNYRSGRPIPCIYGNSRASMEQSNGE